MKTQTYTEAEIEKCRLGIIPEGWTRKKMHNVRNSAKYLALWAERGLKRQPVVEVETPLEKLERKYGARKIVLIRNWVKPLDFTEVEYRNAIWALKKYNLMYKQPPTPHGYWISRDWTPEEDLLVVDAVDLEDKPLFKTYRDCLIRWDYLQTNFVEVGWGDDIGFKVIPYCEDGKKDENRRPYTI